MTYTLFINEETKTQRDNLFRDIKLEMTDSGFKRKGLVPKSVLLTTMLYSLQCMVAEIHVSSHMCQGKSSWSEMAR